MPEHIKHKVLSNFNKEMLITPTSKEHQQLVDLWREHISVKSSGKEEKSNEAEKHSNRDCGE